MGVVGWADYGPGYCGVPATSRRVMRWCGLCEWVFFASLFIDDRLGVLCLDVGDDRLDVVIVKHDASVTEARAVVGGEAAVAAKLGLGHPEPRRNRLRGAEVRLLFLGHAAIDSLLEEC